MHSVHPSADRSFPVEVLDRVVSAEGGSHPLAGMTFSSIPWLVAFEGQDPFAYACAVVVVALAEGAGGDIGGKSDSPYALSNSPLAIPFSSSKLPDSPARSSPTA